MKKIKISSVQKTANIQVIELDSSFVAGAIEAALTAENAVAKGKSPKKTYDCVKDEHKNVLNADGSQVYTYDRISVKEIEDHILPFLLELREALLEG